MLTLPPSVKIYAAAEPVDGRNYAEPAVMRSAA